MEEFLSSNAANFWWGLGAFAVFVLLFIQLGVKGVLRAVDAREEKIARELKESEAAYAKAKQVKEQLDAQMRGAETKIAEMIAEARRDGEASKAKLVEQGRVEIDALRNRALREIDAARNTALIQLRQEIASISVLVAEKIVHQHLDGAKHEELVAQAVAAYEAGAGKAK